MDSTSEEDSRLLADWESVFRQGLLTFWTFVALSREGADVGAVKQRIEALTGGTYRPAEQTLYRQLRRHLDVGLVEQTKIPSPVGPPKNVYELSPRGRRLLRAFARHNIAPFADPVVQDLLR